MSDPIIYKTPLTAQQRTDWLDSSPDTPRTNRARLHPRDLLLEACALERENAALRDALQSIRRHVAPQPSALATAIVATCDAALRGEPLSAFSSQRPDPDVIPMDEDGYEELHWGPDTGWSFYRKGELVRDLDQFEDRFVMCAYRGGQESMVPSAEVHRAGGESALTTLLRRARPYVEAGSVAEDSLLEEIDAALSEKATVFQTTEPHREGGV